MIYKAFMVLQNQKYKVFECVMQTESASSD